MSGERSSGHRCWCGLKVQVDEWGEIIRAGVLVWLKVQVDEWGEIIRAGVLVWADGRS